ncbi:serine/threonine-protein kinase HT1-like [Cynara cardunculus var. scolymus]|uniref:serine/threonine-protein kinase HT1-like n=1 Tax=Cynara cardunculus var. scolymus TaxID=59895 RepID=UPI000D6310C0|nr:serine/threonine-protein kinase HT1-like [Cynara cardunculus var. scolymus]
MLYLRSPSNYTPPSRCFASTKQLHGKRKRKKEYFTSIEDNSMVDLSKLFLGFRFANGAHSQLYRGVYKDEAVAVKIIKIPEEEENQQLGIRLENQFIREVALLSHLHHENVIKFVAACRQPPALCVITKYLSEGSLRSYLHKLENNTLTNKESRLSLKRIIKMALDITRGMKYVHSQGVIHRDLKPENILVSKDFQLKIADFGIGCAEANRDLVSDDPGTYRWMAPEMIKRKPYDRKVDVYGFGLILWEMVAGDLPYKDMTSIQAAFAVVHKRLRPPIPVDCPLAMRTLIELCWSSNPGKRPEFWQVVKVLEEFVTLLVCDGNVHVLQSPTPFDQRKSQRQWIQKLDSYHHSPTPMPKPRFS